MQKETKAGLQKDNANKNYIKHCVKGVRLHSFSGLYFPVFGLDTERYFVSLRIQSERGKMRTRKTLNTDTFYAVKPKQKTEPKTIKFNQEQSGKKKLLSKKENNVDKQELICLVCRRTWRESQIDLIVYCILGI